MPKPLKLKDQIMALHDGKRSTREIADVVYGAPATAVQVTYVRVVMRQRKGGSTSEFDDRYRSSPLGKQMRERLNARVAPKRDAYYCVLRATADKRRAARAGRAAYRKARLAGVATAEAHAYYQEAYDYTIRRTGNKEAARAAYKETPGASYA